MGLEEQKEGGLCTATSVMSSAVDAMNPKLLSSPQQGAMPSKDEEEEEEAALISSSTALLLSSPPAAELPSPFWGYFGGAQPCTLILSSTSRKSIMNDVSHCWGSFS